MDAAAFRANQRSGFGKKFMAWVINLRPPDEKLLGDDVADAEIIAELAAAGPELVRMFNEQLDTLLMRFKRIREAQVAAKRQTDDDEIERKCKQVANLDDSHPT
jgi:hypothetical protein